MMTDDSKSLLRDFSRNRSEDAFRALVRQHSPVVYGTALRRLGGNRAAAQDVTQEVFTLLARKAHRLESMILGGWLYRQTCRRAANHARTESRRKQRESLAMESLANSTSPDVAESLAEELDDALLALPEKDRDALILRFFEDKEFKSLGITLGLSEEAARKRVTRALERLTGNLKRKGIAVGSVSLGTAMQGFGATSVPAAVMAVVSETALKVGATTGWPIFSTWIKPIVAGVAATLVAGSALALRPPDGAGNQAQTSASPAVVRSSRTPRVVEKLPENPTLEQIIAEIRRIRTGPANALTDLRLKVAIAKVQVPQIPEFIALGDRQLTEAEREAVYGPLLNLWWLQDCEATMIYLLEMLRRPQAPPNAFLVRSFFGRWETEDPASSYDWLFKHWEDPILQYPTFDDSLRNSLTKSAVSRMFGNGEIPAIFEFAARIPQVTDRVEALKALTGQAKTHGIWNYSEERKDQWRQVYHGLESISDATCRLALTRNFWKEVSENQPDEIDRIQKFIGPSDPFAVALGRLSVRSLPSQKIANMAGGMTYKYQPVTDLKSRMDAAIQVGLAEGLPRDKVIKSISEVLRERGGEDAMEWLVNNSQGGETDSSLQKRVRIQATSSGYITGQPMNAMEDAAKIRDPDLRHRVSRGAYRRLLYSRPNDARSYLQEAAIPADLKSELQAIATENP
jgi:RNA polymerase sigma factor (sigma-70 family)